MTFLWLLEGIRTPFLDKLMQLITYFGQELIIIAVICVLYCRLVCSIPENHFPYPKALDSGSRFYSCKERRPRRDRIFFSKRSHTRSHLSVFSTGFKGSKYLVQNSLHPCLFVYRFFQNVSGMPHSKRCIGIYADFYSGISCYLEISDIFTG